MVSSMKIASTQMIKPSSPTPDHLRILKLSFLDQLAPPVTTPLIFFYKPASLNSTEILHQSLKQSLSNVLTQFYPLAGRLRIESDTIECNDMGALFVEANIDANLADIVNEPSMDELKQYLPLGPDIVPDNSMVLAVQTNVFGCGGIAVAVQISHKIADATSTASFMNAWAAVCRGTGHEKLITPKFNLADLFPPKDLSIYKAWVEKIPTEKTVTKRFVFGKEELEKLRMSESSATRVEAISSFLLRRFIDRIKAKKGSDKMFAVRHAVNLRCRMDGSIPDVTFGNVYTGAMAVAGDHEQLVEGMKNAIRNVDGDYVKNVLCGDDYLNLINSRETLESIQELEFCSITSWLRIPLYEVDFGWGRPIWVSTTTYPYKNLVILMSTASGDGVEALVNMHVEDDAHS